jgi:hypothetical protein
MKESLEYLSLGIFWGICIGFGLRGILNDIKKGEK